MVSPRHWRGAASITIIAVLAATTVGCGGSSSNSSTTPVNPNASDANPAGDIPDDQVYVPYASPDGVFSVKVPEGWAQTASGDSVTFTDKLNSITVIEHAAAQAPTEASLQSAVESTYSSKPGYSFGSVDTVTRAGEKVPHATFMLDSEPNSVTGKVVSDDVEYFGFFRQGTEVDLMLSGPHGADNVDPWQLVSDSFTWK
jgi:hypothetical protein